MSGTFRRLSSGILGVLATAALLATPMAQAMKLNSQNLTQLISESQSIISGTVSSVADGIDARGIPYTEVTIVVSSARRATDSG